MAFGGFVVQAAERGEPARLGVRGVSLFVREAVARALFVVLAPFSALVLAGGAATGPRGAVLLVSGEGTPAVALAFLATFLRRRGWGCTVIGLAGDHELAGHAAAVGRAIEPLARRVGRPIDVVGFSLGGLAAAWYVRHLEGAAHVGRLVTIGTPWAGTKTAVFGRSRVSRQLLPSSHLLDDLTPPPVATVCVWSPDDPVVVPASSGLAREGAESVKVDAGGHAELLISARVFRAVEAALGGRSPSTAEVA